MTLTVQITEPALKINVLTPVLSTVLVARVHFVIPRFTGQYVAVQVDGLETHILNAINVGFLRIRIRQKDILDSHFSYF